MSEMSTKIPNFCTYCGIGPVLTKYLERKEPDPVKVYSSPTTIPGIEVTCEGCGARYRVEPGSEPLGRKVPPGAIGTRRRMIFPKTPP